MARRPEAYFRDDEQVEAWLASIRAAVPRRRLQLDPRACALLVVDMQRYFADPAGRCFLPAAAAVLPRVASLLGAWRVASRPRVLTRHGHAGPADLGVLGRFYSDWIRADEPEAEIVAPLAPQPGEAVLPKKTHDAFLGTDLEARLREAGVGQVLVTGVLTHLCCETTARAAFCRGFEVYVAADATATTTEALHLGSLRSLADGVGVVMSCREILARCGA